MLQQRPGLAEHVNALIHNLSVVPDHRPSLAHAGLLTPELLASYEAQ